ncbi:hypothetical protein BDV18DRAFT_147479 [Aspergillus unguis]
MPSQALSSTNGHCPTPLLTQSDQVSNSQDLTYFGPTTQPHIQSPSDEPLTTGGDDDTAPMGFNMDALPLRKALLDLYFRLQTRFQILIDESLFMTDWASQTRSQYYSRFLEDAILAFTARHSTSSTVRRLRDKYAARCKSQIGAELDDPAIASLQGLLLLGDVEATRGHARTGWTYCVISIGLMVDLGIHVDCTHLVKHGKLTETEADARKTLLLSGFVYAAQWSLYLGRPHPISQITLRATHQAVSEKSSVWVVFCMRMLDIMDVLNGPVSGSTREPPNRLLELDSELRAFAASVQPPLSSELIQSGELDGGLYSFHMQCCGLQILLHRAILKSDQTRNAEDTISPLSESTREELYETITKNATLIAQLICSYQRIFGVDEIVTVMIDNIFIAAVTLISHVHRLNQQGQHDHPIQWLHFLSNLLQDMEKHFPATLRMRSCLAKMAENSALASIFPPVVGSHNSGDIFFPQGEMQMPGLDFSDLLGGVEQCDFFDMTNTPGNASLYLGSAWMTPTAV